MTTKTQEEQKEELHQEINEKLLELLKLQSIPLDYLSEEEFTTENFIEEFLDWTIEFDKLVDFVKAQLADL